MNFVGRLFFSIMLLCMLAACGGSEEPIPTEVPTLAAEDEGGNGDVETDDDTISAEAVSPNSEPTVAPTNTPEPEPTQEPTNAPEPTAEPTPEAPPTDEPSAETLSLDGVVELLTASGLSVFVPTDYELETFGGNAELVPNFVEDGGILVFADALGEQESVESFFAEFADSMGDGGTMDEPTPISIDGYGGLQATFSVADEDIDGFGQIVAVSDGKRMIVITGGAPEPFWTERVQDDLNAVVQQLQIEEPADMPAVEVPSEDETADAGGDAGPEAGKVETESDGVSLAPGLVAMSSDAGIACYGTSGDGIGCISAEGEWQRFDTDNSNIGGNYISAIVPCSTDTLLVAESNGLSLFDGSNFTTYEAGWGFSSADDVACDSEGRFWVAHFEGVSFFDGNGWETFDTPTYFNDDSLVSAIEIDASGTVWAVMSNHVARYDGESWDLFGESEMGELYFMENLAIDADGVIWITMSTGLVTFDGTAWTEYGSSAYLIPEGILIDAAGQKWVPTFDEGVQLFSKGGWQRFDTANSELSTNAVESAVIDGQGRLWLGTAYGLQVVVDNVWTTYRMDSADLISNDITSIGVLNGGPELPDLVSKSPGSLSASITFDGDPLADAAVDICVETLFTIFEEEGSPCKGQSFVVQTQTDAQGTFTAELLPVGQYVIAVETPDGWKEISEFGFGSDFYAVEEGAETDLGVLVLATDEE